MRRSENKKPAFRNLVKQNLVPVGNKDNNDIFLPSTLCYNGKFLGRVFWNHVTTIRRVTIREVNIEVAIPIINVTANPLTGPDPNINKIAAAKKVVRFESTIVVNAR